MEAGIPDSLLAGLGFSEDLGSAEKEASSPVQEVEEEGENDVVVKDDGEEYDLRETRSEQDEDLQLGTELEQFFFCRMLFLFFVIIFIYQFRA